jgi:hypothetical protein
MHISIQQPEHAVKTKAGKDENQERKVRGVSAILKLISG